jgi:ubiquinone/menaquinone biosynthesis C-methylase UbiE
VTERRPFEGIQTMNTVGADPALIRSTYASSRLAENLLANLNQAGCDLNDLKPSDLIAFDELHVMGRQATIELGQMAGLTPQMHILDLGSALGGPARTLADKFGCRVTGIDISKEFTEAAMELTRRTGLDRLVGFRHADALNLPYPGDCFDAVFMFHLNMNIPDKAALFTEARRVLKVDGQLALWEICSGANPGLIFPVPWAANELFNYLVTPDAFTRIIRTSGFKPVCLEDATDHALEWVRQRMASAGSRPRRSAKLDLDLVLPDFRLKRLNISKNLVADHVRILRVLATKDLIA